MAACFMFTEILSRVQAFPRRYASFCVLLSFSLPFPLLMKYFTDVKLSTDDFPRAQNHVDLSVAFLLTCFILNHDFDEFTHANDLSLLFRCCNMSSHMACSLLEYTLFIPSERLETHENLTAAKFAGYHSTRGGQHPVQCESSLLCISLPLVLSFLDPW